MDRNSVIIAAKRTPVGSFQGTLSSVSAPNLGAATIQSILKETDIDPSLIDEVILGNVLSAGLGQAPARQATIYSGLSNTTEALTINKMCGSGLKAVMLADQSIRCGDAEVIIAGGMESMSNAPYLFPNARYGQRLGHGIIFDSMLHDGLWDATERLLALPRCRGRRLGAGSRHNPFASGFWSYQYHGAPAE